MRYEGDRGIRYLLIWVTSAGHRKFNSYTTERRANQQFLVVQNNAPIWASIICFNMDTQEARTVRFYHEAGK